jgi:hypothetical protein
MATSENTVLRIGEALIDNQTVSARLAMRLAQAALGYIGMGPIYLVASYQPSDDSFDPYSVVPFRDNPAAAEAFALALNAPDGSTPRFGVFGPYQTGLPVNVELNADPYLLQTIDVVVGGPADALPEQGTLPISVTGFDSLFWTVGAVEKFAVPYYTMLYSAAFADHVLQQFAEKEMALLGHMPWSEYTDFDPPPMTPDSGTGSQGWVGGPIPVIHYLDAGGRWHRRPLHPNHVEKK